LQVDAVGPDVDVLARREIARLPVGVLISPGGGEPGDNGGRQVRGSLPRSAASASWKSPVEMPRRYKTGSRASRLRVRRAHFGRIMEQKRTRSAASVAPRSRMRTRETGTGPMPVWTSRSGPWPCRTRRARPSGSRRLPRVTRFSSRSAQGRRMMGSEGRGVSIYPRPCGDPQALGS
jgi:hypothetical protein